MNKDKKEKKESKEKNEHVVGEYIPQRKNSLGIIAIILSITTIVLTFIPIPEISYITGIISLILSIIALKKRYKKLLPILAIIISSLSIIWVSIKCEYTEIVLDSITSKEDKTLVTTGKYTKEEVKRKLDVSIGEFKLDKKENTELVVTIKNKSSKTLSGSVKIKATDTNGNLIGEDYAHFNDLKKGKTTKVKVFTSIDSDNKKIYKTAKYQIKDISIF